MEQPRRERYAHCLACNVALDGWCEGNLELCNDCWQKMTGAERAARIEAARMIVEMRTIAGRQMTYERNEEAGIIALGGLGKSHERFVRIAKQMADELDSQMGRLESLMRAIKQAIDRETGKDDDGEWRDSLDDA